MKRNRAPRSGSSRSATQPGNGIRRISGPSCGISTTAAIDPGESIRVFPLSNWTELDIWQYIHLEKIPIVPLYFAKERRMLVRGDSAHSAGAGIRPVAAGRRSEMVTCRMRSLGCSPCTGAIRSDADTVPKIIEELISFRHSERDNRVIDHDQDGSMEMKKREGYF